MVSEPTEPEQLGLLQMEGAQRDKAATKKMRPRTKKESALVASFVERFIATEEIKSFPVNEADLAEESAEPKPELTIWLVLTRQIESAFAKSETPPSQTASFFASMLLKARDQKYERDVLMLPVEAVRPDRILAHVQSIPIKLEPRVAISVARRTCLVLWNQDKWVSKGQQAAAVPLSETQAAVSDAAADVGATLSNDADDQYDFEERAAILEFDAGLSREAAEKEARGSARGIARGQAGRTASLKPKEEPSEMCMDCGESYEGAHTCAPTAPRAKALPMKAPEPESKPDNSEADAALQARRCVGYVRSKIDQLFSVAGGIGKPSDYVTLPAGEVMELLEPNERDKRDQERAQEVHQHLLVVVRWRGRARVLIHKTVERATKTEWTEQQEQHADA